MLHDKSQYIATLLNFDAISWFKLCSFWCRDSYAIVMETVGSGISLILVDFINATIRK